MSRRILITGANRGLGLEMARQLAERSDSVFATCRQPAAATELQALAAAHPSVKVLPLDVADVDSRARAGGGAERALRRAGLAGK